jgi:large subunit ribosomal protein L10
MRAEKKQLVQDLRNLLEPSASVFLIAYQGLKVEEFSSFRGSLAECGAACHVVPNRLLSLAARAAGMDSLADLEVSNCTAMIVGGDDPVMVAKKLRSFVKENKVVSVKAGMVDGKVLEVADVDKLADLPSKEILLAQLLGVLTAPSQNLVGVLQAKVSSVVYALQAYVNKLEKAA